MSQESLPNELTALIYQIELSDTEWRENLTECLVKSALYIADEATPQDDISPIIRKEFGVSITLDEVSRMCESLEAREAFREVKDDVYKLTEAARDDLSERVNTSNQLETDVRDKFAAEAVQHGLVDSLSKGKELYSEFYNDFLVPLIQDLGARTFELVTSEDKQIVETHAYKNFIDSFPQEKETDLINTLDSFFSTSDQSVRNFVLQTLNAHLVTRASGLSRNELESLRERKKDNISLDIFVDTNFLFSLLDLHENPSNDSAQSLFRITEQISDYVDIQLYVLPITRDESVETLSYYRSKLQGISITRKLGKALSRFSGDISGITKRFVEVSQQSDGIITPGQYFKPYIDNLVTILRDKGLELYNQDLSELSKNQEVIDDISERTRYFRDKENIEKGYEQVKHDILLWHFTKQKRGGVHKETPTKARYWLVTLDNTLTRYGEEKRPDGSTPICVHPSVLIQMLQLWVPRSEEYETAKFNSLRAFLPDKFDPSAERVTVKILRHLSRYENIDDLPEEAMQSILLNDALRKVLGEEDSIQKERELVQEAILSEVKKYKDRLDDVKTEKSSIEDELNSINQEIDRLKQQKDILKQQKGRTKRKLENIEEEKEEEIESLQVKKNNIENRIDELENIIDNKEKKEEENEREIKELDKRITRKEAWSRIKTVVIVSVILLLIAVYLSIVYGSQDLNAIRRMKSWWEVHISVIAAAVFILPVYVGTDRLKEVGLSVDLLTR